jgi:hypothetical protein
MLLVALIGRPIALLVGGFAGLKAGSADLKVRPTESVPLS